MIFLPLATLKLVINSNPTTGHFFSFSSCVKLLSVEDSAADIDLQGTEVFGLEGYAPQLTALVRAAAAADDSAAIVEKVSIFFGNYSAWRTGSDEAKTSMGAAAVPSDDATDEERGWFHRLFATLLLNGHCERAAIDKEHLLLLAVDHALLAAVQVLLSEEFGAKGTTPVEGDVPQKRTVAKQSTSNAKLQSIISSLGAFMGRFRIGKDVHKSATSMAFACIDTQSEAAPNQVLKFMKDESQYKREILARQISGGESLDPRFVVGIITTSSELDEQQQQRKKDTNSVALSFADEALKLNPPLHPHCIAMEAGERNLQVIFLHERPDEHQIRSMMTQIFEAVEYLHSKGIAHNDLKALNILRMNSDKRLRLIDLDAATELATGEVQNYLPSHVGLKFSSGILPPEMFFELSDDHMVEQFEAYFPFLNLLSEKATTVRRRSSVKMNSQNSNDLELWEKIAPKRNARNGKRLVVKTFVVDPNNQLVPWLRKDKPLPYDPVKSMPGVDVWAIGCLLFQLCTGENLEPVTRDDDLTSGLSMDRIMNWGEKRLQSKLRLVKDDLARDLLSQLLSPLPEDRNFLDLGYLRESHPFFHPESSTAEGSDNAALLKKIEDIQERTMRIDNRTRAIDERTKRIEGLALATKADLSRGVSELKKHVTAAADETIPTCFVILPAPEEPSELKELRREAAEAQDAATLSQASGKAYKFGKHAVTSVMKLYGSVSAAVQDPLGAVKDTFLRLLAKDNFHMHLVCELCYESQSSPREGGPWPVEITEASETTVEVASKIVPLAKGAMHAAQVMNGLGGFGRMLGYPIPNIPSEVIDGCGSTIDFLRQGSSVEDYALVEEKLAKKDGQPTEKVKGYLQREFKKFVDEKDPDHDWAGLDRIILDEGIGIWCCSNCCKAIETNPKASFAELRSIVGSPLIDSDDAPQATSASSSAPSFGNTERDEMAAKIESLEAQIAAHKATESSTEAKATASSNKMAEQRSDDGEVKEMLRHLQSQMKLLVEAGGDDSSASNWAPATGAQALQPRGAVLKQGTFEKKGGGTSLFGRTTWKLRSFTLYKNLLRYFDNPSSSAVLGEIPLSGSAIQFIEESRVLVLNTPGGRQFEMRFPDAQMYGEWKAQFMQLAALKLA